MGKKIRLAEKMTLEQFDNGYWYAVELKTFAKKIGFRPGAPVKPILWTPFERNSCPRWTRINMWHLVH